MLLYLVNVIHTFIPAALITGMLVARWTPVYGRKAFRGLFTGLAFGLLSGIIIYFISSRHETATAARSSLFAVAALAAVVNGVTIILSKVAATLPLVRRIASNGAGNPATSHQGRGYGAVQTIGWGAALSFIAALGASAGFSFFAIIAEQALSAITVLNTELILNIGGILAGACLIVFLIPLTAHLSAKSGRAVVSGLLLVASALLVIPWCAEVLLGLMRLEMAEVTSGRLSFVAKVGKYAHAAPYAMVFLVAVLSLVHFAKRTALLPNDLFTMQRAERRKARSRMLLDLRWFKAALASIGVLLAVLLYQDLYASRPPKISTPVKLTPDSNGLLKVKTSEVADGKLHRYSYVTDDGHVVRFFLINRMINRTGGQGRIGVVYDACMLCGDMGYIQEKNEVICIACNVRIFIPSIGKAGGCNPIPLKHAVEGEYVVISAEELDKGARYFSEVISINVKDPVSGKVLDSHKAPYRYEYKGRTYFFESEPSLEKFRASPETYVGEQESRYYRTQGYRDL